MDPDKTLQEARGIARDVLHDDHPIADDRLHELAQLFITLDGWLAAGGFLPEAWRRAS